MASFESTFVKEFPQAASCFDTLQDAHLMHKIQREEGAKCMDVTEESLKQAREKHKKKKKKESEAAEDEDLDVEPEEYTDAQSNDEGLYDRMGYIDIMPMLQKLREGMDADEFEYTELESKTIFSSAEEGESYWPQFYKETVPACMRCNTLMTMARKTTELLMAFGALDEQWYDTSQVSLSTKLRKLKYALLIKKSVEKAQEFLGFPLGRRVSNDALVALFQTVLLALAANAACVPIPRNKGSAPHEYFRLAGIRRLYNSACMWCLCRIRWQAVFRLPFVEWHLHYAERLPMATTRSWHECVFGAGRMLTVPRGRKRVQLPELERMIEDVFAPAFVRLMEQPDGAHYPSLWQLLAASQGERQPRIIPPLELPQGYFFPPPEYAPWLQTKALQGGTKLDIGSWVKVFGKFQVFRRMAYCAVFLMPQACADSLLKMLADRRGNGISGRHALPRDDWQDKIDAEDDDSEEDDDGSDPAYGRGDIWDSSLPEIKELSPSNRILARYQRFICEFQVFELQCVAHHLPIEFTRDLEDARGVTAKGIYEKIQAL